MQKIKRSKAVDAMPELKMLPVFYLFPQELLDASPFSNFPRNPYTVLASEKWMAVYKSDKFLEIVIDGTANMVWKHFGIKASMESFSGYHPFWMIARMGEWMQTAERFGINTHSMTSETFEYPVLSWDAAENIFRAFVEDVRRRLPLDAWRDAVKQYPCHEDYEPSRWSKGRIDFYRKWYHSRAKIQASFVGSKDDWDALAESASDPWGKVNFWLDFENFKKSLSAVDRQIFEMLFCGYTQNRIAAHLGYANHSAVSKRAKKIAEKYREYQRENDALPSPPPAVKNNWDEMTRLLFPKAKPRPAG